MMTHHRRVILVERQTVDWLALDDRAFYAQSQVFCRLWDKPEDYIWRLKQLWDASFAVSYCQVRARLKQLAHDNWRQADALTIVPYQATAPYANVPRDRAAIYLFVDDDDWVSPTLVAELLAASFERACLWRATNIGSPNQQYPVFTWGLNGRVMTNNYAVAGNWLWQGERGLPEVGLGAVAQHHDAAINFRQSALPQLDAALTASNKSPCSSVSLDRGLAGDLQPEKLVALVAQYNRKMAGIPVSSYPLAAWLTPWLQQTQALFTEVLASAG